MPRGDDAATLANMRARWRARYARRREDVLLAARERYAADAGYREACKARAREYRARRRAGRRVDGEAALERVMAAVDAAEVGGWRLGEG
jgi:hypothetical protein